MFVMIRFLVAATALLFIPPVALAVEVLPAPVAQALKVAGIPGDSVSLLVRDVDSVNTRVSFNARQAMNPASVIKLLTTYAALDILGPAYTWQTDVWLTRPVHEGVLDGDLYIRGGGDPKFTYEQLWRLLRQVRQRGIREIRGDLVLDRSAFLVPESDPGAFDDQPMRPYNVLPDALLLNFHAISLRLMPESAISGIPILRLGVEPELANLDIVNRLLVGKQTHCGDWREALRADTFPHGSGARLVLTGTYPAICGEQIWNLSPTVGKPYFAGVFQFLWAQLGGSFTGNVRDGSVPAEARQIAILSSPTLAEVVRDINKYSNNVMARQLFLTLGMASGLRPARAEDGELALRNWLAAQGLDTPELVLDNGSGLSRRTRISSNDLARLLQSAWASPVMPEMVASLPVTATDGTMKKRLRQQGVAGRAHIKTGSLEGVRAIAGYVLDRTGRRVIVVFMVNHPKAGAARAVQDVLLQWVYERS